MTHVDAISRLPISTDSDIALPTLTAARNHSESEAWAALSSVAVSTLPLHNYPLRPQQTFACTDQSVLDWDDAASKTAHQASLLLTAFNQQYQSSALMATTRSKAAALSLSTQTRNTTEHSNPSDLVATLSDSPPMSTHPETQAPLPPALASNSLAQESHTDIPQPAVEIKSSSDKPYFIASKVWHEETQLIKRCTVCQQDNVHASISHPAISIPIPDSIFDTVHMDLLEMVPSDDQEPYVYIFLLVDRLSKYPVAFPIRNKEAATIADCLWNAICLFGVPTTIVSDRGREFVNETVEALCTVHGIDRRVTSAYRPQANGQVERTNKSLLDILRKCTAAAPARWTEWLDYTLLALRTAVHASTGFSPFQLMFGRPFRGFLDFTLLATWDTSDRSPAAAEAFAEFSHQLRQASISSALDNAARAQERQRHSQDAHRSIELQRLPPKSVVYLREVRPDSKLAHRFVGPFFVHHTSNKELSANYLIADDRGKVLQQSYPRDQLFQVVQPEVSASLRQRRLYSPEEWTSAIAACSQVHSGPLSSVDGTESLWVIDKLLDRQVNSDGNIVLVKWSGYADPQWIPESNIPSDTLSTLLREWRHEQALQSGFGAPSRLGRRRQHVL